MIEIIRRQELADPQMAETFASCRCCGGEIYHLDEFERNDGLCDECARAMVEDVDEGDGFSRPSWPQNDKRGRWAHG